MKLSASKACEVMLAMLWASAVVMDDVGELPMSIEEASPGYSPSEALEGSDIGVPGIGLALERASDMAAASAAS